MDRLFNSLDIAGMGLLKYLDVWQNGSMNGLGLRLVSLEYGLRGNINECLGDFVHSAPSWVLS